MPAVPCCACSPSSPGKIYDRESAAFYVEIIRERQWEHLNTAQSVNTPTHPPLLPHNFILTFHWLRNVSSYSNLFNVECSGKPLLDPALSVLVRQSAIRVWPPPRPGSGSVGVSPARCPAARRCQHHVLLIKMACEHKLSWPGSWGLHTPQPILKSTKQHYHYYIDPNLYFSSRRNVKW